MRLEPINLHDYEARAKELLPYNVWNEVESGAMDEVTTRRNRTALEALVLKPRLLRDVQHRDLSTTILGTPVSMPVFVCPAGGHKIAHTDGEKATAQGAGMSGTIMVLSTGTNYSIEEVAEVATGPVWLQLNHRSKDLSQMLVRRAEEAGFKAVCLTVDSPVPVPQERSIRNRYDHPFERANFRGMNVKTGATVSATGDPFAWRPDAARLTWEEIDWLRSITPLPLVLKGIRGPEDALLAVEHGVNGVLVSNHGGRQVDMTLSSIESLPEIVETVNGRLELYLDSGIRRGSDVLKALALGVRAVGIGRPLFWGLAVGGAEGVHGILEILRKELDRAMAFCGQTSVQHLERGIVGIPRTWGLGEYDF
ncbi:MAG: alpha-hydroxy-acid oxidizing protein [SAR202 cluster bacterium]|nr:alpha-hydroxy-acid oxidizing protein [SAR202 cluster bacterium]